MSLTIPFDPNQLRIRCLQSVESLIGKERYRFIDNGANILAVAHVDTIAHTPTFSKAILEGDKCYFSPALDDRLGVYTILDVLPQLGLQYDILLTTDEEKGMTTASLFTLPEGKEYNWIFEFDRRGAGAVYYQYANTELAKVAAGYFKTEIGSFSDISALDHLGCAGINVATGYYNEHTYLCHMIVDVWQIQVARFVRFYSDYADTYFRYVPGPKKWDKWDSYGSWWGNGSYSKGLVYNTATKQYEDPKDDGYSDRFLALSDGQTQPEDDVPDTVLQDVPVSGDEADFISYTNRRRQYELPLGEVEHCAYCGGNADLKIGNEFICSACDNENWWTERRYSY